MYGPFYFIIIIIFFFQQVKQYTKGDLIVSLSLFGLHINAYRFSDIWILSIYLFQVGYLIDFINKLFFFSFTYRTTILIQQYQKKAIKILDCRYSIIEMMNECLIVIYNKMIRD